MTPYEQGYEAARQGLRNWQNPYHVHREKEAYAQWEAGWQRWGRNLYTVR